MADTKSRAATVLGWIAGGSAGLLLNYVGFLLVGPAYPVVPTTFALFVAGAFGGMAVADRVGHRGFKALGITAGVLLAIVVLLAVAVAMSEPT